MTAVDRQEETVDETAEPPAPLWKRIITNSNASIALILLALIFVFSALRFNEFFAIDNARNISTDAAVLLVIATGLTYVIITAGIDLSVGGILVFSGVVSARAMHAAGGDNWGKSIEYMT
jgi:ribose transport system permease protein